MSVGVGESVYVAVGVEVDFGCVGVIVGAAIELQATRKQVNISDVK